MSTNGREMHDIIIVGGGSAGSVLAERLTAGGRLSVLLIEAGGEADGAFIPMPMGLFKTLQRPDRTWQYITEADEVSGKRHAWTRGRMLGGSGSLNGMLYFRGQPEDYDGWEQAGCRGWGWNEMFRIFRAMEDHELGDDGVRGVGGPLRISVQKERTPLTEAILCAGRAMGLPSRDDLNRPDQEGIAYSSRTIHRGRRFNANEAFLSPARRRRNLRVITHATVERVVIEDGRATGVECRVNGVPTKFVANREVILCAGALQSPVLMQHSGLGPATLLRDLGIPVVRDMPEVGNNAREHKLITMFFRTKGHSLNREFRGLRAYWNGARYFLMRRGPLAATYDINAFIRTRDGLDRPDAQMTIWALTPDFASGTLQPEAEPGLMMMGYPLRTESKGTVRIRSARPSDPPEIRANFLTTDYDRRVIIDLFRYARRFFARPELRDFIVRETHPGPGVETDEEIIAAALQENTCYHTVGTCRMGADPASVVDERLRVRGIGGLRIADCSVMPTQVSGNPNGPVMALAWRAAELILEDNGLNSGGIGH